MKIIGKKKGGKNERESEGKRSDIVINEFLKFELDFAEREENFACRNRNRNS